MNRRPGMVVLNFAPRRRRFDRRAPLVLAAGCWLLVMGLVLLGFTVSSWASTPQIHIDSGPVYKSGTVVHAHRRCGRVGG